jgi:hypothetical protein
MDCRDTVHLICWYLEGKLSPSVEREIERHLNRCRDCRLVWKPQPRSWMAFWDGQGGTHSLRPASKCLRLKDAFGCVSCVRTIELDIHSHSALPCATRLQAF